MNVINVKFEIIFSFFHTLKHFQFQFLHNKYVNEYWYYWKTIYSILRIIDFDLKFWKNCWHFQFFPHCPFKYLIELKIIDIEWNIILFYIFYICHFDFFKLFSWIKKYWFEMKQFLLKKWFKIIKFQLIFIILNSK